MDEMNYWEEVQKNMHPGDYDAKGRRKKDINSDNKWQFGRLFRQRRIVKLED